MKNLRFVLVGLVVLPAACTGSIGGGERPGTAGTPGPKPNDPGIIDNGTGGGPPGGGGTTGAQPCTAGNPPATTRVFRLTHGQYDNAIRALTGLDMRPSAEFPVDQNQAGFDRGMDLQVGDALGKSYRNAAEAVAAAVVASTTAFSKVVGCDPAGGDTCANAFIASFGRRVLRRPLSDAEKTGFFSLFGMGGALVDGTADNFHKGVQVVIEALLQSPHFIHRVELSNQASGGLIQLGGFELASRLSFFLVNGPPDDALLDAAERRRSVDRRRRRDAGAAAGGDRRRARDGARLPPPVAGDGQLRQQADQRFEVSRASRPTWRRCWPTRPSASSPR